MKMNLSSRNPFNCRKSLGEIILFRNTLQFIWLLANFINKSDINWREPDESSTERDTAQHSLSLLWNKGAPKVESEHLRVFALPDSCNSVLATLAPQICFQRISIEKFKTFHICSNSLTRRVSFEFPLNWFIHIFCRKFINDNENVEEIIHININALPPFRNATQHNPSI